MARDLYAEVSARIIEQLENGTVPWVKPWRATAGANVPCNAVTNRPYSGVNVVILWAYGTSYKTPRYLTYKQAQELGGNVRKGEHGYQIVYVKPYVGKSKDENGDETEYHGAIMKAYTVFNVDQCEGLPDRVLTAGTVTERHSDERDATIDEFVAATGANVHEHDTDRACYSIGADRVEMPRFRCFKSADNFYATLFHELGHWTGASHRCAREFGKRFGDMRYAAEELVAELTSAFLCAEFGLDGDVRHASYIATWITLLKDDKRAFFTAASKAQAAADYLRGKALSSEEAPVMAMAA